MWSNSLQNRQLSSSGCVAYEIAMQALRIEYEVVGVRYNAKEKQSRTCYIYQTKGYVRCIHDRLNGKKITQK